MRVTSTLHSAPFRRSHCRMMCISKEEKMSRMSVWVCVMWCNVWVMNVRWGKVKWSPVPALANSYRKAPSRPPSLLPNPTGHMSSQHIHFWGFRNLIQIHLGKQQRLGFRPVILSTSSPRESLEILNSPGNESEIAAWVLVTLSLIHIGGLYRPTQSSDEKFKTHWPQLPFATQT